MLESALHWLGFGLCHQLPERSFFGGGVQLPVCARDAGIYFGFMLSIGLVALLHRKERPAEMPRWWVGVAMGLMALTMAWDGFTSYAGMRQTTNDLRLITGLAAGWAAGALLVPVLNSELWRRYSRVRLLESPLRFGIWLLGLPIAYAAIRWVLPLSGAFYPFLTGIFIIATYASVNLVLVALLPVFDRKAERMWDLVPALAVAFVASAVEIVLSAGLRVYLGVIAERIS